MGKYPTRVYLGDIRAEYFKKFNNVRKVKEFYHTMEIVSLHHPKWIKFNKMAMHESIVTIRTELDYKFLQKKFYEALEKGSTLDEHIDTNVNDISKIINNCLNVEQIQQRYKVRRKELEKIAIKRYDYLFENDSYYTYDGAKALANIVTGCDNKYKFKQLKVFKPGIELEVKKGDKLITNMGEGKVKTVSYEISNVVRPAKKVQLVSLRAAGKFVDGETSKSFFIDVPKENVVKEKVKTPAKKKKKKQRDRRYYNPQS
ncbi:hypothetical protein ACFL1H_04260 [Nanoarchaeota archaeon]